MGDARKFIFPSVNQREFHNFVGWAKARRGDSIQNGGEEWEGRGIFINYLDLFGGEGDTFTIIPASRVGLDGPAFWPGWWFSFLTIVLDRIVKRVSQGGKKWAVLEMAIQFTEKEISRLINERKPLNTNYQTLIQVRPKRGHNEKECVVSGVEGNKFHLILRQSLFNNLDFSVILAYQPENSNLLFRLRRYNGKSHEHTNTIEKITFYDFHVHQATERYQDIGAREDTYAEPMDRYANLQEALGCMIHDCGFELPNDPQGRLF